MASDVQRNEHPPGPEAGAEALARARAAVAAVVDPEIPILTLEDLGILRGVAQQDGTIIVELTPTYIGCPATFAIRLAVEAALAAAGLHQVRVVTQLSPPWSTDAITESGRRKLKAFGIAPPARAKNPGAVFHDVEVACPRCDSSQTSKLSEFGSTACKAQWRCDACREPFDYFKCI